MGWFKRIFLTFMGLVLAGIAGLYVVIVTADPARLSSQASTELSKLLGEEVTIAGAASVRIWPLPGLHTGEVSSATLLSGGGTAILIPDPLASLAGEDRLWGVVLVRSRLSMAPDTAQTLIRRLAAQKGSDGLGFLAMLAGQLEIGSRAGQTPISRVSAILVPGRSLGLELSGDWQGRAVSMTALAENAKGMFTANGAKITLLAKAGDDMLSYSGMFGQDAKTDQLTAHGIGAVSLHHAKPIADALGLEMPGLLARLMHLEGTLQTRARDSDLLIKLNAGGVVDDRTLSFQVRLEGGADWRETGPDTMSVVSRGGGMFSAYLDGTFSAARKMKGKLSISVLDLPRLQKWLGLLPDTRLLDATRATFAADIRLNDDGFEITNGELQSGEQIVATSLKAVRGDPASLTGQLAFQNLDLSALHQAGYDRLRLILSELETAGVDLAIEIESASTVLEGIKLGAMKLGLAHRDGTALFEIGRLEIMNGLINGRVELATRGPAHATGQIALAEIDAQAASKFFGLGLVSGAAAGAAGFTIPDLTRQADGQSKIDGTFTILDGGLVLPDTALGPTTFRSANLNLTLADGRVRIEELSLRSDGAPITGHLDVTLADKSLEGRLQDAKGTTVELGGTMSAPIAKTVSVGNGKVDIAEAPPNSATAPATPRATGPLPASSEPETADTGPATTTPDTDAAPDSDTASVEPESAPELPTQVWSETRAATLAAASAVIAAVRESVTEPSDADAAPSTDGDTETETETETGTTADTGTDAAPSDERTAEIDPRIPIPVPAPR